MQMVKPQKLNIGDTVALISPSWGCAGSSRVRWKYQLGVDRLKEIGLNVVAAPNSLRGTTFLRNNPNARAEDVMWAFDNPEVKGIICNIGGNDSEKILQYLDPKVIVKNPKIFCGYSDVMNLHLYINRLGIMTYYGDNLLTTIAEQNGWHPYSRDAFVKAFFDNSVFGNIESSYEVSYSDNNHTSKTYEKVYEKSTGYRVIQGCGSVTGRLFGGHGGIVEYADDSIIKLTKEDFADKILFFEDIDSICDYDYIKWFFDQLGNKGWLQVLNGILIGKLKIGKNFDLFSDSVKGVVSGKYGLESLPIIYGANVGHISPINIMPYGAEAKLCIYDNTAMVEITENIVD